MIRVLSVVAIVAATFLSATVAEARPAGHESSGSSTTPHGGSRVEDPPPVDGDPGGLLPSVEGLPAEILRLVDDVPGEILPPLLGRQLYVDPAGNDSNDGSVKAPLRTIQAALDKVTPGTQVNLAPGEYRELPLTKVAGLPSAPITIKGPEIGMSVNGRRKAVLYVPKGRGFRIDHSHYTLTGFTINGQEPLAGTEFPTDLNKINDFKESVKSKVVDNRLIYVGGDTVKDITGVKIHNMYLRAAGGECVRLRNNAHHNSVTNSLFEYCGMFGKPESTGGRFGFHNGEGVYIGTSPGSTSQPMHENDPSSDNVVARNVIRTFGSECFNVKENAHDNVLVLNLCSDNTEPVEFQGSNVELRGHANTVRNNKIFSSTGVGVKVKSDEAKYDKGGNTIVHNLISDAPYALQWNSLVPPGPTCENKATTKEPVFYNNTGDYGDGATPPDFTGPCVRP